MSEKLKPTLEEALEAYDARFDNLDEVMLPQLMEDPRLPGFLLAAVDTGKAANRESVEAVFGPVSWDW